MDVLAQALSSHCNLGAWFGQTLVKTLCYGLRLFTRTCKLTVFKRLVVLPPTSIQDTSMSTC
eukprot:288629-Amphidinium_carterae.1